LNVQPEECLFLEDNVRNLRPAKALGMITVLVKDGSAVPGNGVDHVIAHIEEIGDLLETIAP
jgi:FMN phosphatase YigB (HAD superfamily)